MVTYAESPLIVARSLIGHPQEVRYLGIEVDDALAVAEQVDV
jgi:hypothetical protein